MNANDISKVLSTLGIDHYLDHCNPSYTIHIHDSRLWSYTVIDTLNENGQWQIIPMNRSFISGYLNTPEELIAELTVRGYLDGRDTVVGEKKQRLNLG